MSRKTLQGLVAVFGVWLTAGFALPFVNILDMFSPEQLMVFRGYLTALMVLIGLRGVVGRVDKYTYLIALTVPFATLGLFEGIRHWGAGPTIIIITATPLVNFAVGALLDRRVSPASIIGFVLVITGVVIARWGGDFQWAGFGWSMFGTLMNGILYEWFSRAKSSPLQKAFWGSLAMGTLGLVLSTQVSWAQASWTPILDPKIALTVLGFAFVGGFLYWIANVIAFEKLPTIEASILVQGETPAVILGASFLLGERLTLIQWTGVFIALYGAAHIIKWLSKKSLKKVT